MTKKPLPEKVREWSETPSVNPRYKGATPTDVARALLGEKPLKRPRKEDGPNGKIELDGDG